MAITVVFRQRYEFGRFSAGAAGIDIPSVEGIILLSCAVFSVLITRKVRFSTTINVLIVAFFAFFHGFAHGQEISTSASLVSYTLGFMLATLLLHGAGILVAKLVVLAISCLLTMLFSQVVLAKATNSVLDSKVKQGIIDQPLGFDNLTFSSLINGQAFSNNATLRASSDCNASVKDSSFYRQLNPPDKNKHQQMILTDGKVKSAFYQPNELPLLNQSLAYWLLHPVVLNCRHLDFKYYFPDINYTPGRDFLTNGVGLTSPPSTIAFLSHISVPRDTTLFSASEDSTLPIATLNKLTILASLPLSQVLPFSSADNVLQISSAHRQFVSHVHNISLTEHPSMFSHVNDLDNAGRYAINEYKNKKRYLSINKEQV